MKCYHITAGGASLGIPVQPKSDRHPPAVLVGEAGRGRKLTPVPVVEESMLVRKNQWTPPTVERAVPVLRDGKVPVLRPERTGAERDDPRVLLLLAVAEGYRGGLEWTSGRSEPQPCPNQGREAYLISDPVTTSCPECGTMWTGEVHPTEGEIPRDLPLEGEVTVVARGFAAQGGAGRMGGGDRYLVIAAPGAVLRVSRWGRLYGSPSTLWVEVGEDEVLVESGTTRQQRLALASDDDEVVL